jgi:alanyl aminopeptidase
MQAAQPETRDDTWTWLQGSFDALVAHLPERASGETPWLASGFCDAAHGDAVKAFFAPRIDTLPGGPRNLAGALESIQLCAARVAAQRDSTRAFLARQ